MDQLHTLACQSSCIPRWEVKSSSSFVLTSLHALVRIGMWTLTYFPQQLGATAARHFKARDASHLTFAFFSLQLGVIVVHHLKQGRGTP